MVRPGSLRRLLSLPRQTLVGEATSAIPSSTGHQAAGQLNACSTGSPASQWCGFSGISGQDSASGGEGRRRPPPASTSGRGDYAGHEDRPAFPRVPPGTQDRRGGFDAGRGGGGGSGGDASRSTSVLPLPSRSGNRGGERQVSVPVAKPLDPHDPEHNLAIKNAPQQVFELIGDPRSGVADDVTNNPFGEVTVDMIWHQLSNEVYWYRYEYAGNMFEESHRDTRLSDYSKNLMYILRAKDPERWSIDALAEKFHIRKQRVLAILAFKEMESHRLEQGQLLPGPSSIYACPVYLEDVHLDAATGEPIQHHAGPESSSSSQHSSSGSGSARDASSATAGDAAQSHADICSSSSSFAPFAAHSTSDATLELGQALQQVVQITESLQAALLQELKGHGYDIEHLRAALLAEVDKAEAYGRHYFATSANPSSPSSTAEADTISDAGSGADDAGSSASANGVVGFSTALDFTTYKAKVGSVLDAVAPFVSGSQLQLEAAAARVATAVQSQLEQLQPDDRDAVKSLARPAFGSTYEEALEAERAAGLGASALGAGPSAVKAQLQQELASLSSTEVSRIYFHLAPELRDLLTKLLPSVAIQLNQQGVDLHRSFKDANYWGPQQEATAAAAAAASAASNSLGGVSSGSSHDSSSSSSGSGGISVSTAVPEGLTVDMFGFQHFPEAAYQRLLSAVDDVTAAVTGMQPGFTQLGATEDMLNSSETSSSSAASSSMDTSDVRHLRKLLVAYQGADDMYDHLQRLTAGFQEPPLSSTDRTRMLQLMVEADPGVLDKLEFQAEVQKLKDAGQEAEAVQLSADYAATASSIPSEGEQTFSDADQALYGATRGGHEMSYKYSEAAKMDWDMLAAYIDARVVGRIFHRGSGERHFVRLPTYPAFQGYSLSEFDSMSEGEVSRANRLKAAEVDAEMYTRFRQHMLFNLGLRGQRLVDSSQPKAPPNLRSLLDRPMVVYAIRPDGATVYPPMFVANPDRSQRPLNEQELVYQERRQPKSRLAYHIGRVRRMHELE